jgi:signal-transduction protein with cAMP-binding, CBS, and nucleotidyltransferase domain
MTKNIVWLSMEKSVVDAAIEMHKRDISSVLVKSGNEFVGIVTDRDIISKVVAQDLNPKSVKLAEVMKSPLISIADDASVQEAAEQMRDNKIRRLVVKNKKQVVGIISSSDIIRVEPELHFLIRERSRLGLGRVRPLGLETPLISGICEDCRNYSPDLRNVDGKWLCEECRGR